MDRRSTTLGLTVALVLAAAATTASAGPPGEPRGLRVAPGLQVTDGRGAPVVDVSDLSSGEIVLRTAVTRRGDPVVMASVGEAAAGRGSGRNASLALRFAASAADGVTLSWTSVAGARAYSILRDGALLGTTSDVSFTDDTATPGEIYGYTVETDALMAPEPVVDPDTGETVYPERHMGYAMHTQVVVPTDEVAQLAATAQDFAALSTASSTSSFTYKTFIAQATAPGFPCVKWPTNTYFNGNNRGYSSTSTSVKTRMSATANWDSRTLSSSKAVGTTINYNNDGSERSRMTATSADMRVLAPSVSSTRASFTFDHSASNPYCTTTGGAIRYNIAVSIYKNGSWITSGYRRPVPHHEAYVRHDLGTWRTVLQRGNSGWQCLTGVCGTDGLSTSGSF